MATTTAWPPASPPWRRRHAGAALRYRRALHRPARPRPSARRYPGGRPRHPGDRGDGRRRRLGTLRGGMKTKIDAAKIATAAAHDADRLRQAPEPDRRHRRRRQGDLVPRRADAGDRPQDLDRRLARCRAAASSTPARPGSLASAGASHAAGRRHPRRRRLRAAATLWRSVAGEAWPRARASGRARRRWTRADAGAPPAQRPPARSPRASAIPAAPR